MAIDYFSLGHPLSRLRSHYACRARERMLERFLALFQPGPNTRVLDLGATPDQTLPESNHFAQRYPHPAALTLASIEDISALRSRFPHVTLRHIQPGVLPFADGSFDVVFCSAVLEHVGDEEQQRRFVAEILRVGKAYFLTTPNRWFPLDFHTLWPLLHWLPRQQHQRLLRALGMPFWARTENLNLLSARGLRRLFPVARVSAGPGHYAPQIEAVRLFGWPSNLIVHGRA